MLLAVYKKEWFVAAIVNNEPITNFELLSKINKQYRQQVLNQLINEKIILQEALKRNISVTQSDLDNKIKDLEKNVGGAETLDQLLAGQNQTRDSLKEQLKIQIIVEKLFQNQATVSAQEIDQYITQNKSMLTASDSA